MAWHVQDWSTSPLLSQSNWKHLLIYFIRSIHWDLVGSKLVGLHIPVDCHILVFPVWLRSPSCRHINHDSNYRRWAFWDWPAFEEQTRGGSSRWSFTCCRNEVWWRMSCGVRHCKLFVTLPNLTDTAVNCGCNITLQTKWSGQKTLWRKCRFCLTYG